MENPEFWTQLGIAGAFLAYFMKKETLWEAEKKEMSSKYEGLLREALTRATHIDAMLVELSSAVQFCKASERKA